MANMTNTTKMANRYGVDLTFTRLDNSDKTATIDFANSVSLSLSREIVWATGGKSATKMIGFKNPYEGTLSIEMQITNMQVLNMLTDGELDDSTGVVNFKDDITIAPKYYKIVGDTLFQKEDGTMVTETITVYKAMVKPTYDITYDGSGDPQSITLEFELASDSDGKLVDVKRADKAAAGAEENPTG